MKNKYKLINIIHVYIQYFLSILVIIIFNDIYLNHNLNQTWKKIYTYKIIKNIYNVFLYIFNK